MISPTLNGGSTAQDAVIQVLRTKRRHVYSETSRQAGLEFVCIFGHDAHEYFDLTGFDRLRVLGESLPIFCSVRRHLAVRHASGIERLDDVAQLGGRDRARHFAG